MAARRDQPRKFTLRVIASDSRIPCSQPEFYMPLFHDPRRRFYTDIARDKYRLRIAHTERLQPPQGLKKLRRNLIERKLGIDGDAWLEVFESQMLARISIKMHTKIFHLR